MSSALSGSAIFSCAYNRAPSSRSRTVYFASTLYERLYWYDVRLSSRSGEGVTMARRAEPDGGAAPDEARSGNGGQGQRRAERLHDSANRRAERLHDAANHRQPDSAWLRPARAPRGQRRPLDRDMIVRAAIEVADEEGPDAISMRRIAARLGVGAMSL